MKYYQEIHNKNAIISKSLTFYDVLVIVILGMVPINIFRHGGYQLVDTVIVLAILVTFYSSATINDKLKKHINLLSLFAIWCSIVCAFYAVYYNSYSLLIPAINMVYVFFILYAMTMLFIDLLKREKYIVVYLGIFLSFVSTLTFKGFWEWEGSRNSFSFNNPNQLGLYSLFILAITIMLLSHKLRSNVNNKLYYILDVIIILVTHYFILMAISRSDIAATVVLDIYLLGKVIKRQFIIPAAMGILIAIVGLFYINPSFINERKEARPADRWTGEAFQDRFKTAIKGPFSEVTGLRVFYGTAYLGVSRKAGDDYTNILGHRRGLEVHNMLLNVLWGYGVIGFILYVFWLIRSILISKVYFENLFIWAAILVDSIGGVIIRFRMYWIALAFMFALLSIYNDKINDKTSSHC